ncbi:MAG TPA: DUF58 domain-containing protein [Acidimicrobiales bacterium]|nr:DUF58 domain-containing protein [Acidimicrobiales bacterium]
MSVAERAARLRWGQRADRRALDRPPSAAPAVIAAKAALLRRLELDMTRRLDGLLSGDYLAFATGPGTEPAGARPYGPGDDARRIDWSLTARALDLHVRTTEAERELETCVVVDRSASLDFGTAEREKREVALAAMAAFGFLTVRAGNRLSVLVAGGEELTRLPARNGRAGVLAALSEVYDTPRRDAGPGPAANLAAALLRVERTQLRRGQIVVVSDFLDPSDWPMPLRRLGLRHQVIAAHVTDPRELELPPVGMLAVVDVETGRHLDVQTNSAGLRQRYAAAAAERRERIHRSVIEAGAEYLSVTTDRDWLLDVASFVGRRRRTRTRPVGVLAAIGGVPGGRR